MLHLLHFFGLFRFFFQKKTPFFLSYKKNYLTKHNKPTKNIKKGRGAPNFFLYADVVFFLRICVIWYALCCFFRQLPTAMKNITFLFLLLAHAALGQMTTVKGPGVTGPGNKFVADTIQGVAVILTQGQVILGFQRDHANNLEPIEGEGYNVGAVEALMIRYREPDDPKLTKSFTISYVDFQGVPIPADDVLLFKIRKPVINKPQKK